ncbi:MAG TPA: DUF6544 family protein [Thermoanaerobaculia bacterium]|nr:DUF6544 family protein [Thermoanaerobaculia bacterium]
MRVFVLILALMILLLVSVVLLAGARWRGGTARLVARLRPAVSPSPVFSAHELEGLPAPVAFYLAAVIPEGQPLRLTARLQQKGSFLLKPTADGWRPFTAVHHVCAQPPGFVWDARIAMAPGLAVRVRDSFVDGVGGMNARLGGLVKLVHAEGTPEIAAGALVRWLAEATWLPAALLPASGVRWEPLDDTSARAHLEVGATRVALDFHFGPDGLVERVYTPGRGRDVDGQSVPTPWQGRFGHWERRGGMLIPLEGEVEWLLPEGPQPYWRGRISGADYR